MYHLECPWPAAQRELYMINAYKVRPLGVKRHREKGFKAASNKRIWLILSTWQNTCA
ncbi:hypothetical protein DPMN_146350 [Dreissena polymorpha]|uniref:Uncharacterized protein n=1 Tax=Dreissena polymorpha TaxID=45954 RepID=A0A9D4FA55_DREPO|nr:hypothetical protein DPMN_146350 [Dreissena polymorpha]